MKIRALILIVLTAGWALPAGALACSPHSLEAEAHSHAPHDDGHEPGQGASGHGPGDHHHAARGESGRGDPGAPSCCSCDTRAPVVVGSALDTKPRPKSILLALSNSLLDEPRPVVLPRVAWLRLRQPAPLPYARTRRPLLI